MRATATKRPQPTRWPKGDDGLTDKERETWRIMLGYQDEHGVAMSVYDVARALGVAGFSSVHDRVNRLVGLGLVSKHRTGSRHKYLAVSATPREASALVTSAEIAAIEAAAESWRAKHGRPASLGEALAGIVEEWSEAQS